VAWTYDGGKPWRTSASGHATMPPPPPPSALPTRPANHGLAPLRHHAPIAWACSAATAQPLPVVLERLAAALLPLLLASDCSPPPRTCSLAHAASPRLVPHHGRVLVEYATPFGSVGGRTAAAGYRVWTCRLRLLSHMVARVTFLHLALQAALRPP